MSTGGQQTFGGMPTPRYSASPSKLLSYVDCPRRYRLQYLDRPKPEPRPQRAHTSLGIAVHNALRDWWEIPVHQRSAAAVAGLVDDSWVSLGFRDAEQSRTWRNIAVKQVTAYLRGLHPDARPHSVERTVAAKTDALIVIGRIDRLDERPTPDGGTELVVVDYKTSRRPNSVDELRGSLPMALYAVAVSHMFRRECVRVELHHVPSNTAVAVRHTEASLARKMAEAESIALDLRRADADYAEKGTASTRFPPRPGPLCAWCDFRAHCPEGQLAGPEKSDWAALEPDDGAAPRTTTEGED